MNESPYLSVIVPAFNEQNRIADSLYAIKDYLSVQPYRSEIIVVDDGSNDLTTEIVKFVDIYGKQVNEQDEGTLLENLENVGKGYSIARGMMRASGEIILFTDADLSTPIEEIEKLLPEFESGADVVIGSRNTEHSIVERKPWYRRLMSGVFNVAVRLISVTEIHDTQCGFKAYRKNVALKLANNQQIYGFGFDVEHLYIAQKLGFKIREVGVEWSHKEGSKVDPLKDSLVMMMDLIRIRLAHGKLEK